MKKKKRKRNYAAAHLDLLILLKLQSCYGEFIATVNV